MMCMCGQLRKKASWIGCYGAARGSGLSSEMSEVIPLTHFSLLTHKAPPKH